MDKAPLYGTTPEICPTVRSIHQAPPLEGDGLQRPLVGETLLAEGSVLNFALLRQRLEKMKEELVYAKDQRKAQRNEIKVLKKYVATFEEERWALLQAKVADAKDQRQVRRTQVKFLKDYIAANTEERGALKHANAMLVEENEKLSALLSMAETEAEKTLQHVKALSESHQKIRAERDKLLRDLAEANLRGIRAEEDVRGLVDNLSKKSRDNERIEAEKADLQRQLAACHQDLDEAHRAHMQHLPWMGFEVNSTAHVVSVHPEGPAEAAGVQVGDRCTYVDGIAVETLEEFRSVVRRRVLAGDTVMLRLQRNDTGTGREKTLRVFVVARCVCMKRRT